MSDDRTYDYASARIVVDGREVTTRPAAIVGPQRPALAHVLAALTDGHVARYADVESVQELGPITRPGYGCWPWAVETPAEAVEVLATRSLWPWPVGDDAAPRWWGGVGRAQRRECWRVPAGLVCELCEGTADPPTLAAIVAVASLGVDTLRAAEGLAGQLVGRAPRLVWRVMTREALRGHHAATWQRATGTIEDIGAELVFSGEMNHAAMDDDRAPFASFDYGDDHRAAPMWPVLRDLHGLGLHSVALDGDRVTLAVEAI